MASSSCSEENDDFGLLGDGDGDGKAKAKAKTRSIPDHASHSNHHHQSSSHQIGEKRKEGDSPGDLSFAPVVVKKRANSSSSGGGGTDVYRKDREEWSDGAIETLLDAYTQRFELLNRGNLRGRDWEDVAAAVNASANAGNSSGNKSGNSKTVEQCKNKIDNLKKRFKVECNRISSSSGLSASHWPWYAKLHLIVSNPSSGSPRDQSRSQTASPVPNSFPIPLQAASIDDDDGSASVSGSVPPPPNLGRQNKRYAAAAPAAAAPVRVFPGPRCKWKRVLLKVSGAALNASPVSGPHNVDPKVVMLIAREIQMATRQGVQVAVVVGGRNIFCGDSWIAATAVDRASTYQICMMASVMNAMLLQASLEKIGVATRVQTNLAMQEVAEPYIRRKAISHLEKGRVVIFGGIASGLGNPLFTTDAAAALRASEINADAVLKGTTGDALYGCHPGSNNSASFEHISYREFVSRGFTPMDTTAVAFCEENNIPVVLFNLLEPSNISRALAGDQIGTLIDQSGQIG